MSNLLRCKGNKQQTEATNTLCVVVECFDYRWRKIVKFFGDLKSIYASISNRHNVKIIIALSLKVVVCR